MTLTCRLSSDQELVEDSRRLRPCAEVCARRLWVSPELVAGSSVAEGFRPVSRFCADCRLMYRAQGGASCQGQGPACSASRRGAPRGRGRDAASWAPGSISRPARDGWVRIRAVACAARLRIECDAPREERAGGRRVQQPVICCAALFACLGYGACCLV